MTAFHPATIEPTPVVWTPEMIAKAVEALKQLPQQTIPFYADCIEPVTH
jgi:hypothetical protein